MNRLTNRRTLDIEYLSIADLLSTRLHSDAERDFPVSALDVNPSPKPSRLVLTGELLSLIPDRS
jgi:hypothetical protein